MENRVRIKLISSTIVALLLFTVGLVAVSPPALAEKGEVLFTDVTGAPVKLWRVGETLFITIIDPDENRDSDEVELIGGPGDRWFYEDELGNQQPVIELVDPNTGDYESSRPQGTQLILQETGVSTGVFRSQFGILIGKRVTGAAVTPNNGILEVVDKDTIYVRYRDPTDQTDIDTDVAKIDKTRAIIKITNGAGTEIDLFHVGNDVFVTVTDPDENTDPTRPETIKDVVLEDPRTGDTEILTLVETGPNTGIFRNADGVTLVDKLGTTPESDYRLAVNDKDTIVAYYRSPAGAPPIVKPETRTDCNPDESLIKFCRTVPVSVKPGDTFEVKVEITAKVNLELAAVTDTLPPGFTLVSGSLTAFQQNVNAGAILTNKYQVKAGANVGTFNITGTARAKPVGVASRTFDLSSAVAVKAATATVATFAVAPAAVKTIENSLVIFTRDAPERVNLGDTFTVTVKITAKVDLELSAVTDSLSAGFTLISGNLTAFKRNLKAGESFTNTYQVKASATPPGISTISGTARSKQVGQASKTVTLDSNIIIGAVIPALPGWGDMNDQSDFALDMAKIAEPNPSTVTLTDVNGTEKTEFRIGEDLFITVNDDDENIDSDATEIVYVDVFDINGGRERVKLVETGLNTGVFRNPEYLRIVGVDSAEGKRELAGEDVPGVIAVHNEDVIYVKYADVILPTFDPFDVTYTTATILDCQVFTREGVNKITFVDDMGSPVGLYKKGHQVFVQVDDCDQNERSELVEVVKVTLMDWDTGDLEEINLEETGPNTGVFRSRQGMTMLRPAPTPVPGDGILQIEERDTIVATYHDPNDPSDFGIAEARIVPQPRPIRTPSDTRFTDSAGRDVTEYVVGDNVFVKVTDQDKNRTSGVADVIRNAVTVENVRTGQSIKVDLTETGPDTGVFMTPAITTSATGMLQVADGDILRAEYVDPEDPTDRSSDTANIITAALIVTAWRNTPNPFSTSTTFEAVGTGVQRLKVMVYDLTGRLVFEKEAAGNKLEWNGRDMTGARLPNGVYLYILTATGRQNKTLTSPILKLVILK